MLFRCFSLYFSACIFSACNFTIIRKWPLLDIVKPKYTNPCSKDLAGKVEIRPEFELGRVPNEPFPEGYTSPNVGVVGIHESVLSSACIGETNTCRVLQKELLMSTVQPLYLLRRVMTEAQGFWSYFQGFWK